ncbi:hypothetical protein RD110_21955 [Rhodoferax koreense]|uniref:Uncharacterized protein n=1 Tax=Rhodoferax koreensis TaxID=1842727 RepID=A0A1P8K0M0_9BURK|nr:hypothetical protein RD110_21955 [Rhodoferax koreense]
MFHRQDCIPTEPGLQEQLSYQAGHPAVPVERETPLELGCTPAGVDRELLFQNCSPPRVFGGGVAAPKHRQQRGRRKHLEDASPVKVTAVQKSNQTDDGRLALAARRDLRDVERDPSAGARYDTPYRVEGMDHVRLAAHLISQDGLDGVLATELVHVHAWRQQASWR